jgi:integrase
MDPYYVKRSIEYKFNELRNMGIPKENKEYVLRYDKVYKTNQKSQSTRHQTLSKIFPLLRFTGNKHLRKLTRKDIEKFFEELVTSPELRKNDRTKGRYVEVLSSGTLNHYKQTIKKFMKFVHNSSKFPKCVDWIELCKQNNTTVTSEHILTVEEVKRLIEATSEPRMRCFVAVLYESGARIGEILGVKLKDIEFDETGALMIVHGKTGTRRIRLITSVPELKHWLNHHPFNSDCNSSLWVDLAHKIDKGRQHRGLGYSTVSEHLKILASRAGIQKNVRPHLIRHSRLTHLAADGFRETHLRIFAGWANNSMMPSIYLHLGKNYKGRPSNLTTVRRTNTSLALILTKTPEILTKVVILPIELIIAETRNI